MQRVTGIEPKYITDYVKNNAESLADKLAVDFENEQLTWRELWLEVKALSGYFCQRLGSNEQKVVALLLTNSSEFIKIYLAVLEAGHIVMPLDPAYKKLELDAMVRQIMPEMVITSPRYRALIGNEAPVILAKEIPNTEPVTKLLRIGANRQIASLTFTSGTSGKPKAVPNTHANHMWSIKVCSEVWRWTENDSLLICLPLSHWYGMVMGLSGAIYHGNSLYLKQQAFHAEDILDELSSGKISMFTHVPLAYAQMIEAKPKHKPNLSRVRLCISGGAALAPAIWEEFNHRFGVEIVQTYGSSETGRIAGNRLDKKVLGSPGPPLPEVDLKLSDEQEVLIKSPGVFPGYYKNPEATKKSKTSDGYWRTGDIAEIKDGNIHLMGRAQERIRRFSYTVSPRDVEWALLQNPDIKDVFVMGRQHSGEPNDELIYFIVTKLSNEELRDYFKANLLFAWRPDRIIHLESLPRTRTGKTSIPELRRLVEQAV